MRRFLSCAAVMAPVLVGAFLVSSPFVAPAAVDAQVLRGLVPQRHGDVDDLKPGALLVASRSLGDPNFVRTVILLVHHDERGAMGLVLNRQTDIPIGRVFESIEAARDHTAPVFIGGPVAQTGAQALVRSSSAIADGRRVVGDVYALGSAEALTRRLANGLDADRFRLYLGYAGWGPGQLEDEVDDDAWHIFEANAGIVFDSDPGTLWLRQIRRTDVQMVSTPGTRRSILAATDTIRTLHHAEARCRVALVSFRPAGIRRSHTPVVAHGAACTAGCRMQRWRA